ncbi:MAG: ABC transporter substrate-binding protein [Spirochaetales bacterium]|nr:ABC transporter substrate-binding protein [Spirochaetales bacterium]
MKRFRRFLYPPRLSIAGFLLFAAFIVYPQEQTLKLAVGYIPHIQFTPLYVGIEKGFYREEKINLNIEYGVGIDIFSLLAAGRIDVGLSDSDQLLVAGAKGLNLKAIFQYYQRYPVTIVALENKIRRPEDFAGKIIGTPELFGTSYIGLRIFLEKYGLQETVKIQKIGYTQIQSLLGNKVDGAVCFFMNEPLHLRERNVPVVQWDVKEFSDMVGVSFISSEKIIARKTGILKGFVRATARAVAYTIQNPDEACKIAGRFTGQRDTDLGNFPREVLDKTLTLFESAEGYGFLDEQKYQQSIDILFHLGLINRTFAAGRVLQDLR